MIISHSVYIKIRSRDKVSLSAVFMVAAIDALEIESPQEMDAFSRCDRESRECKA